MRQFARFLVVGLGNTLVSFAAYQLLLLAAVPYAAAALLAFAAGALNGYVFNRLWTFAAKDTVRARISYVCVAGAGALATSLAVVVSVRLGVSEWAAYLVAVPPVTLGTFFANRLWTFAERA